jgi:F0F1-type ATP synthase membrane subunit a
MLSGHALLKILVGFSWVAMISKQHFWFFISFLPWVVVCLTMLLELAIAGLQAYVFVILICIYINDAVNCSH